mmetsp:Transcript_2907/g.8672  ORF Transcript_2907/g.8672 Transcript_2907/m.8672 type:complete len:208 (+) Transcript_2907:1494-2117(+)
MWPLKVLRFCCRLCESPTSTSTLSNHMQRGSLVAPSFESRSRQVEPEAAADADISADIADVSDFSHIPTGMARPALAIRESRPNVLRDAVLPPVLGPVTTTALLPCGMRMDIGVMLGTSAGEVVVAPRRGSSSRDLFVPARDFGTPRSPCSRSQSSGTRSMPSNAEEPTPLIPPIAPAPSLDVRLAGSRGTARGGNASCSNRGCSTS